jgi:uncharacterized MAPEG superfamily protein
MAFVTYHQAIPWACLFGVLLVWMLTNIPVGLAQRRQGGRQNELPRQQPLDEDGQRMYAAHVNAFEGFVFFYVVVLLHTIGGGYQLVGSILSGVYLLTRILHPIFYKFDKPTLRSLVWGLGIVDLLVMGALAFATPLGERAKSFRLHH